MSYLEQSQYKDWATHLGYDKEFDDVSPRVFLVYHFLIERELTEVGLGLAARVLFDEREITQEQREYARKLSENRSSIFTIEDEVNVKR